MSISWIPRSASASRIDGKSAAFTTAWHPLRLVESAVLLASLRRLVRPADVPPLSPIRSLACFQPVIEELLAHPVPGKYLEYLQLKLRGMSGEKIATADVQKSTFSDDRQHSGRDPARRDCSKSLDFRSRSRPYTPEPAPSHPGK